MENICKDCYLDSKSHSFCLLTTYINDNTNIDLFYTRISDAKKYNDSDGIINHYNNYLNFVNPVKWSWIVDFHNFEMKHFMEIKTTKRLAKLIKDYGKVDKIIIINPNSFLKFLLHITIPILGDIGKNIIIFSKNHKNKLRDYLKKIEIKENIIEFICY